MGLLHQGNPTTTLALLVIGGTSHHLQRVTFTYGHYHIFSVDSFNGKKNYGLCKTFTLTRLNLELKIRIFIYVSLPGTKYHPFVE